MLKEFKDFVMRGNVLDLAIGVIIGGAFGKIVASLVNDILMPIIGLVLGGVDFTKLAAGPVTYGNFIQAIVDFLIVAFVIFLVIKSANSFKKTPPPADPTTKECPKCFSTISIKATRCPHCTSELK
jgi:large conductance mechanosensitive channel